MMKIDVRPLIDAIDRYIAKADDDLEDTLEEEGYAGVEDAIEFVSKLEESINDTLEGDSLEFLKRIQKATGVDDFILEVWPDIKNSDDLQKELYKIFRKQFDEMMHCFTYEWMLAENPVLAGVDKEITRPAEAFIEGWSDELSRIMNLNTKDAMEKMLLKAQKNSWSIDELAEAIGDSGIRNHGYRSRRVALTEMLRAESYAQQESMVQNPLCYKKRWRHVDNDHPRENHVAIDGQEVYKRECFELGEYRPLCPRDTSLPASEAVNCHCIMESIEDKNALGMSEDELKETRKKYMDDINTEYEAWEKKFKDDYGIDNPRDDPSVTWEIYNSYYEAYRRGETA
jgi:hypothetical protein